MQEAQDTQKIVSAPAKGSNAAAWILGVAVALFVAAQCAQPSICNDLFWQLRTGHLIVSTHRAPQFDTYSWTEHGRPWVAHEWLAFVLFWTAFRAGGFGGVFVLEVAVAALTWPLIYQTVHEETARREGQSGGVGSPLTAFLLSVFAAGIMAPFCQPRPQMFTYLFLAVTLLLVLRARRDAVEGAPSVDRSRRGLWLLVPVFVVWANLHAGVLVGLGLVLILAAGDLLNGYRAAKDLGSTAPGVQAVGRTLLWVGIAGALGTLVTPYGIREYQDFTATVTNKTMLDLLGEWSSPNFHTDFGKLVEGYLALLLYGLFFTRLRRDPTECVILALLAHEALSADRNVPLLVIIGTPLIARHVRSALSRHLYNDKEAPDALLGQYPSATLAAGILVAVVGAVGLGAAMAVRNFGPPGGQPLTRIALSSICYGTYPDRACRFIEREHIPPSIRMYNSYNIGSYLIWRLPDHRVFIDSRADVYFGTLLGDVSALNSGEYEWRSKMDKRKIDMIVVPASEKQSRMYLGAPDWALVYVDRADIDKDETAYDRQQNTFIFLRRTPAYAGLIARCRRDCPAVAALQQSSFGRYESLE
ncbi:MAG: hypothetical protein ACLQVD_07145 [Capsulimonadaceae bacterium]